MTKNELITNLAKRTEMSKKTCELVIDSFIDEVKDCLARGIKIVMTGFMSFEVIERAERKGKDLNTGCSITYPPVKSIKCRASKAFKDAVNKK